MQTLTTAKSDTAIGVSGSPTFAHLCCNHCQKVWRRSFSQVANTECPFCYSGDAKIEIGGENVPADWKGMVALSPLLVNFYYRGLTHEERLRKGKQLITNGYISLNRGGWYIEHEGDHRSLSLTPVSNGVDFLALENFRNLLYGLAKRQGLTPAIIKDDVQLALWSVNDILNAYKKDEPAKIGDFKYYMV